MLQKPFPPAKVNGWISFLAQGPFHTVAPIKFFCQFFRETHSEPQCWLLEVRYWWTCVCLHLTASEKNREKNRIPFEGPEWDGVEVVQFKLTHVQFHPTAHRPNMGPHSSTELTWMSEK